MCAPSAESALALLRLAASFVAVLPPHLSFPNISILPTLNAEQMFRLLASVDKPLGVKLRARGEEHSARDISGLGLGALEGVIHHSSFPGR